jgi:hypothetical protein
VEVEMMNPNIGISDHAVRRYIERLNPVRGAGARYVYSARHAGVCLVVSGEWRPRERDDG